LTSIENGTSTTTISGATLASVSDGNHAINLHRAPDKLTAPDYIACGDIAQMAAAQPTGMATSMATGTTMAGATPVATTMAGGATTTQPSSLPRTGGESLPWLLIAGAVLTVAGLVSRRRSAAPTH
jgi:LPXTG-motif cell wall-anchored protein